MMCRYCLFLPLYFLPLSCQRQHQRPFFFLKKAQQIPTWGLPFPPFLSVSQPFSRRDLQTLLKGPPRGSSVLSLSVPTDRRCCSTSCPQPPSCCFPAAIHLHSALIPTPLTPAASMEEPGPLSILQMVTQSSYPCAMKPWAFSSSFSFISPAGYSISVCSLDSIKYRQYKLGMSNRHNPGLDDNIVGLKYTKGDAKMNIRKSSVSGPAPSQETPYRSLCHEPQLCCSVVWVCSSTQDVLPCLSSSPRWKKRLYILHLQFQPKGNEKKFHHNLDTIMPAHGLFPGPVKAISEGPSIQCYITVQNFPII